MNFDTFFDRLSQQPSSIHVIEYKVKDQLLNNEALFQLPLISLIILLMAKDKRKPNISEIGQLVGECIEASMPGFRGSAQHIGWSANLRIRTVKALSFLEMAKLIIINNRDKKLQITDLGKKVIGHAMSRDDNLSYNLAQLSRAYRNISVSRKLDLELL
ncbi:MULTISPECIES: hypothetical protein [Aeromonas]|uniref:hypothetical protein n=1 Tax=Aeromonas TaxID=642 RepID=UPI0009B8D0AC|nr:MULTISPECIES: hypothetical protein [Aeromonas]MBZ6074474.1 hypothetical protein [Aeromonas schubertii]MCX9104657.1 hypothetical protein [Aeromonas veronii]MCX9120308.1 hypothetical protein [Aeromonas veronii]